MKGTTGNSTGVHLHFEISKGKWSNKYTHHVNPARYSDDPDTSRYSINSITKSRWTVCTAMASLEKSVAFIASSEKGKEELGFSSPTLKSTTETFLLSKAHRQIVVDAAVKAGTHAPWTDKLADGTISRMRTC